MGMPLQSLALLLIEHKRRPLEGPVLIYGVQGTNLPFLTAQALFAHFGMEPHYDALSPMPAANDPLSVVQFFALLGLGNATVLDVSDYEGADVIVDLNVPVPADLRARFGLILDGGTMEHVFDIRQGMANTVDMLRTGGTAVHITPSNNYFNHGFVQVSPTLYYDYYRANGFDDVHGTVIVHPRRNYYFVPWKLIDYDTVRFGGANSLFCDNATQLAVYFSARKTAASTSDVIPIQSYFGRTPYQQTNENHQFDVRYDETNPTLQLVNEPESATTVNLSLSKLLGF
ncbi:MAG: hypothetical protein ABSH03_05035 [Candidatus Lustribacter sp.]|jgi:hypothetical protein